MERVTASLHADTISAIRRAAGPRSVSAFLELAARERLARLQLLALIDDLDARHGRPSAAIRARVDARAKRVFGR